jgi:hypothetical protein
MELDRFLNLVATVFGGIGSIYVLKAIASLSPNLIERLSRTYVSFSAAQIDSLAAQKADSIVGIVLLLIALVIAVLNLAFVPPFVRLFDWCTAIALVVSLAGVACICLVFVRNAIRRNQKLAVGRLITTQVLNELFESKRLPASAPRSLRVYARTLLDMPVDDSESPRQLLERLAKQVGLSIPDGFDFSEVEKPAR